MARRRRNGSAPRYVGLRPASAKASRMASASSRKRDTNCEVILRRTLWERGLRYRLAVRDLPGHPDIVFARARLVVFCDGDFWHGRRLPARLRKLAQGHNASYWVAKLRANVARDKRNNAALTRAGWFVLRFWETDVLENPDAIADAIARALAGRGPFGTNPRPPKERARKQRSRPLDRRRIESSRGRADKFTHRRS